MSLFLILRINRQFFQSLKHESTSNIIQVIRYTEGLFAKCQLYGILLQREGLDYSINGSTGMSQF
jgi:hypothetical protein